MQFRDLKQQYQVLKKDIDEAMIKVATDCNFISGAQVSELEKELAEYVGVKHCITCANGTDALSIAMMAWGIGSGDAVFVPDFTFFSSGEIVSHCGATPVFVDVDQDTYNLSVESLEIAIEKVIKEDKLTPKAIVAVDLFGLPFFPAKPLGCYGDGGAVFTDNDQCADLMRSIRVHGKGTMKYDNVRIGLNSRLDTIQAAILSVKLKAFKEYEVAAVNKAADRYTELLKDTVKTPIVPDGFLSSWAQYTIQLSDKETRDKLQQALKDKGIPSMIYYPKPMHKQLAFGIVEADGTDSYGFDCSVTERLCDTVLSLPMHPYLKDEDIRQVVEAVKENVK